LFNRTAVEFYGRRNKCWRIYGITCMADRVVDCRTMSSKATPSLPALMPAHLL